MVCNFYGKRNTAEIRRRENLPFYGMNINLSNFLISQNISADLKGPKVNCTIDDVRGRFIGLPHGTTPAAVTKNKNIKMSSYKSSENIQKKEDGPYIPVSDNQSSSVTLNELAIRQKNCCNFEFQQEVIQ